MDTETQTKLEDLVDQHGLSTIIGMLADVALAKEEHIASNWSDQMTAKTWNKAAVRLLSVQQRLLELNL